MKRFKVTATRTDEYIIEIDEEVFNDEWKVDFEKTFYKVDSLEDVVKDIAFQQIKMGSSRFLEGFGNVKRNGELPFCMSDFKDGKLLPESERDKPAEGLNIILESEDEEFEFEVEEVQP